MFELEAIVTGAALLLGSFLLRRHFLKRSTKIEKKSLPPLPPDGPSLAVFGKEAQNCRLPRHQLQWAQEYGTVYTIRSPFTVLLPHVVLVGDIAVAKQLLVTEQSCGNFTSRDEHIAWATQQGEGNAVTSMIGEEWKWRKTALLREFHKRRMGESKRGLLPQIVETSQRLCSCLSEAAHSQKPFEVDLLTTKVVIDVILFFMFGRHINFEPDVFRDSAQSMLETVFHFATNPFAFVLRYLPWTKSFALDRKRTAAWKALDGVTRAELERVVREIQHPEESSSTRMPGSAMVSLLQKEPRFYSSGLDPLVVDCRIFIMAGFETTAHALSFTFGLLATHPEIANRIAKEGKEVWSLLESKSANEIQQALDQAPTARLFFAECIRLYPLVPTLPGSVKQDILITTSDGHQYGLPGGTQVLFTNMVLNRQQGGDSVNLHQWEVPPEEQPFTNTFNTGTHVCPGKALSLLEAHVFLLMAATRFEFSFANSDENPMDFMDHALLKPKDGMPLMVRERT